ncbi:hypothetical protein F4859DRAFT_513893 [Xylaria cf. heliscus]|nr:hypothetical protein F4859DRAFT_513893 [Xylaria cf. heliscus]
MLRQKLTKYYSAAPPKSHYHRNAKHSYLRGLVKGRDAREPIHAKVLYLQSITNRLIAFQTTTAKLCFLLHLGNQRDLVELAMLSPFESLEELAQGLELFFPKRKNLPGKNESHFVNNLDVEKQEGLPSFVPYSPAHCAPNLESTEGDNTTNTLDNAIGFESVSSQSDDPGATTDPTDLELLGSELAKEEGRDIMQDKGYNNDNDSVFNYDLNLPGATNLEPGENLYCVGGALLTPHENDPGPFTSNVVQNNKISGSDQGHPITIRQNYAPWAEPPAVKENKFHCLTQGYAGRGSAHLRLHRGRNKVIGRWSLGSEIKYSIDYDSFLAKGRSKDDATYALRCLQTALEVWNCLNIGVSFEFVEPKASSIVFQLKYMPEPWGVPLDVRYEIQAMSFFPVEVLEGRPPREVYVFDAAFDAPVRSYMTRTFLHEVAHILGGRHEDAATTEKDDPSVQLGSPNDLSVLATNRHPSLISLHWQDIRWFHDFMRLPEGHKINGFPICDIAP